jgi:transposase
MMYNARRKLVPALPGNINEVQQALEKLCQKTNQNEKFLLENNINENMVIFSTKTNLKYLCKSEMLYVVFDYCTKYFTQLFTIHGYFNGHYIPLVFCLLKDKRELIYRKCFEQFLYHVRKNDWELKLSSVVLDFEIAIHNTLKYVWPETRIVGCRFHLTQAWWRKIQQLGLTADYKNKNSEIGQWLGYCFGLLFLEAEKVSDVFVFELCPFQPPNVTLQQFADYLVDNYISEDSLLPLEVLSKGWVDDSGKCQLNVPPARRKLVILLHAGNEDGWVNNELLLSAKNISKSSADYHQDMDSELFEKWFKNNLVSNLTPRSLIAMDNASYHSRQTFKIPNTDSRNAEILEFMEIGGLNITEKATKTELLNLIKNSNVDKTKTFYCDSYAAEQGHTVLGLPPYYCVLNPIELVWSQLKHGIRKSNKTPHLSPTVIEVIREVSKIIQNVWINCVNHVKKIEDSFLENNDFPEIIINVNDESSGSEDEDME